MKPVRVIGGAAALLVLVGMTEVAYAGAGAVGVDGPGGGELTTSATGSAEVDSGENIQLKSSQRAVTRSGCVFGGSSVRFNITLPANGSFLHRVVPDRSGFNIVMNINYPGLSRRVNQFGPGRAEAFTVRTPNGRVSGSVTLSGVRGSFGCFTLRVTP
jgi:hypothetical protein